MKTVKKAVILLIAILTIEACHPIDNVKVRVNETKFYLAATVTENNSEPGDALQLEFTEISKCNLEEPILVVLDSEIRILNAHGDFMVRDGSIDFVIPKSGCYLIGNFDGKGSITDDHLVLNATIEIEYGTGTFSTYSGVLSLNVVGERTPDQLMRYSIEIENYLWK